MHLGKPFGILVWLRPAAAKCNIQLALRSRPKALAAASCGETVIYALAAALKNATYALPSVKHLSRICANVSSNALNKLTAFLVLHMCVETPASKC